MCTQEGKQLLCASEEKQLDETHAHTGTGLLCNE